MGLFEYVSRMTHPKKGLEAVDILWATSVGLAAGFLAGILFAPETGKETRAAIAKTGRLVSTKVKKSLDQVKGTLEEVASEASDEFPTEGA